MLSRYFVLPGKTVSQRNLLSAVYLHVTDFQWALEQWPGYPSDVWPRATPEGAFTRGTVRYASGHITVGIPKLRESSLRVRAPADRPVRPRPGAGRARETSLATEINVSAFT